MHKKAITHQEAVSGKELHVKSYFCNVLILFRDNCDNHGVKTRNYSGTCKTNMVKMFFITICNSIIVLDMTPCALNDI